MYEVHRYSVVNPHPNLKPIRREALPATGSTRRDYLGQHASLQRYGLVSFPSSGPSSLNLRCSMLFI